MICPKMQYWRADSGATVSLSLGSGLWTPDCTAVSIPRRRPCKWGREVLARGGYLRCDRLWGVMDHGAIYVHSEKSDRCDGEGDK